MLAKIAVLVSGGGTNLQALFDAQDAGTLKSGEVVLVVSNNKNAYALKRAELRGVETVVADKEICPTQEDFEAFLKT
ncbi:MAG: formyltransferase family protein, partial [Evtepia sp.]